MRKIIQWIPNTITLINLLCGSIAIIYLFKEEYNVVILLTIISLIADFLDGLVARSLKAQSLIGKDLDSLADIVSFGLLPSMVLYHLTELQIHSLWNYLCFSVLIFSAIRLAKFNHDTRQSYYFIGLPTPANAIMILSLLIFILNEKPEISEHSNILKWNAIFFSHIIYSEKILRILALISSILLIFPINLIALKFNQLTLKNIRPQLIFLLGSILIFISLGPMALFWIMIWYILWSIIWYYIIL